MSTVHNTEIIDYKEIWESIKSYHNKRVELQKKRSAIMKVKRIEYLKYWEPRLKQLREDTTKKFEKIYAKDRS